MPKRTSIDITGFRHGSNPIPAAARIANIMVSGAISGVDITSGKIPETAEEQCANIFAIMGKILEVGGSSFNDIIKVTIFIRPGLGREILNQQWVEAFPDPSSRPARHTISSEHLPSGMLLQCEFIAVLPDNMT